MLFFVDGWLMAVGSWAMTGAVEWWQSGSWLMAVGSLVMTGAVEWWQSGSWLIAVGSWVMTGAVEWWQSGSWLMIGRWFIWTTWNNQIKTPTMTKFQIFMKPQPKDQKAPSFWFLVRTALAKTKKFKIIKIKIFGSLRFQSYLSACLRPMESYFG